MAGVESIIIIYRSWVLYVQRSVMPTFSFFHYNKAEAEDGEAEEAEEAEGRGGFCIHLTSTYANQASHDQIPKINYRLFISIFSLSLFLSPPPPNSPPSLKMTPTWNIDFFCGQMATDVRDNATPRT